MKVPIKTLAELEKVSRISFDDENGHTGTLNFPPDSYGANIDLLYPQTSGTVETQENASSRFVDLTNPQSIIGDKAFTTATVSSTPTTTTSVVNKSYADGLISGLATTYIQNQSATPQSATFNITGLAKAGSSSITGNSSVGGDMAVGGSTTINNLMSYNLGANGDTNYERVRQYWSGNVFNFRSENGGSGVAREILFTGAASAFQTNGSSIRFNNNIDLNGNLSANTGGINSAANNANALPITTNSGVNIRGTNTLSTGVFSAFSVYPTVNQTGNPSSNILYLSPYFQAAGSGAQLLINAGSNTAANNGGTHTSVFSVDRTGNIIASGKGTFAGAPTGANDVVRLTDLKSNKLNTAASATITTAQLLANNGTFYIYVDASGGARTITLLSVAAHLGKTVVVMKTDASTNTVNVVGSGFNYTIGTTSGVQITENGTTFIANSLDVITNKVVTASGNGSSTTIVIPHGVSNVTANSYYLAMPRNSASSGISYATIDATNISIVYTVAPASGTNNLSYSLSIKP